MPFLCHEWAASNFIVTFFDCCCVVCACSRTYAPLGNLSKNTFPLTFSKAILSWCFVFGLLPLCFGNSWSDVVAAGTRAHVSFFCHKSVTLIVNFGVSGFRFEFIQIYGFVFVKRGRSIDILGFGGKRDHFHILFVITFGSTDPSFLFPDIGVVIVNWWATCFLFLGAVINVSGNCPPLSGSEFATILGQMLIPVVHFDILWTGHPLFLGHNCLCEG